MRNPLNKRLFREIVNNKGKYISILLLLSLSIGFVSGFFLVQKSVKYTYENSHIIGNVEDANIELNDEIELEDRSIFHKNRVIFDKNYFINIKDENRLYRIYANRDNINIPGIYEGKEPENDNEILVEKIYATNNNIKVGSKFSIYDNDYIVSGIAAFPDYSTLLRNSDDFLMDTKYFCVATITQGAFDKLSNDRSVSYVYSYTLKDKDLSVKEQVDKLTNISKAFIEKNNYTLSATIKESNKNISFLADDMGGDVPMVIVLFSVILVIMAFVFIVIVHGTIEEESKVIGTLLASGYSRKTILVHYLMLPLFVTILSIIIGNIMGYTFFKSQLVEVYVNSYSIFPFIVKADWYAFTITSSIPLILILAINYFYINRKLKNKPLAFLRRELNKRNLKNAVKLPNFSFITRYRLRVLLRNKGSFIVLFLGILFGSVLLIFGLDMSLILNNYIDEIEYSMPSNYQTFLKAPLEQVLVTENFYVDDSAGSEFQTEIISDIVGREKKDISLFTAMAVEVDHPVFDSKIGIQLYGVDINSKFLAGKQKRLSEYQSDYDIYATEGFLKKTNLAVGDKVTLYNKFKGESYNLRIVGKTEGFASTLSIVMPREQLNDLVGNKPSHYNGIMSDDDLGLDSKYVASKVKRDDMRGVGKQLIKTFSSMAYIILIISIAIFFVVMYVLSKSIIEKYTREIAYLRIFGYTGREINNVYIRVSTVFIILSAVVLIPIEKFVVEQLFNLSLLKLDAYISFYLPSYIFLYAFLAVIISYVVIRFFLLNKVKKIEMVEALKDVV